MHPYNYPPEDHGDRGRVGGRVPMRGRGCWPILPMSTTLASELSEAVGAENSVRASDQRPRDQPPRSHGPAVARHDRSLWPSDSPTCCSPGC